MAAEFTTKVRLVRCPKCRLLLPELPDFQVYRCGGCGTTLQAKNGLNGLRSRSSGLNGTVAAQMNGLGHGSEDKASSSSSCNTTLPDSGECSSDQINEKNQSMPSEDTKSSFSTLPDSGECFLERNKERYESKSLEGIESSSSSLKAMAPDSGECSLEIINERDESTSSEGIESSSSSPKAMAPDSGECSLERINESKSSEGIESSSSSPKATAPESGECFSDHKNEKNQNKSSEIEESSSLSHKSILPESGECTSYQNNRSDPDKSSKDDCGAELLGDLNLPNEDQNNQIDQNDSVDLDIEQLGVSKEICSSVEFASNETMESLPIAGASSEASINDESLPLAQPNVEVDFKMVSDSRSSSAANAVATRGSSSINSAHLAPRESISSDVLLSSPDEQSNAKIDIRSSSAANPGATRESDVTAHMSARESSLSDTLTSSPNEQLEELQKGFDHLNSSNTYEFTDFLSPRSEFSAAVRDASKSPATRSHHAYDGSVSSYDGIDDQFSSQNLHTYQDTYKAVRHEERHRRDKFLVKSMMNRDSELQNQARTSWSSRSDNNDNAIRYRNRDQDELLPPRRQGHPSRDYASVQRAEYMSRMAYLQRGSLGGYDNGSFTNQMHNEFQRNSGYQSDKSVPTEPDKMTLLRMVYELQNQVNNLNVKASRQEKHIPQYHNYEASEEELFHGLNHPRDLRRSRAGSHYTQQQSKFTRIPFSSEATTSRHQVDPSYMHGYPQDRQYSAPMPLPIRCNTNGLCRVHPGQSCYASSQWDSETMSDDQRHNSREVKKYFGEKQQMAKRHFRPIAGGAPIVTCYNCFKPLQIPADFLLFKRKCHRLQCGACLKVLKFSLHKRTHIVPYGVNAIGPPPSEVEDHSYGVNADPVSCSDDYGYGYGLSYCKSGSTEGGVAGNVAPSNSTRGNSVHERNMSYGSNNLTRERQEIVLRRSQSQNKDKNPVERFLSAKTSSNMLKSKNISSEIEELPAKSSSPLHRLMGYRSPSQVIRGVGLSRSGTKSSLRN